MKRNGFALASAIIGTVGLLFGAVYYYSTLYAGEPFFRGLLDGYVLQAAIAISLNWAAWAHNAKTPMLIAAILYCPAIILMYISSLFFVLCVIFGFIAYAGIKRATVE